MTAKSPGTPSAQSRPRAPAPYLPYAVRAGSDRSWNRHPGDGEEYLDRSSMQRLWLDLQRYQLVLERAFINHTEQKITFLGVGELAGPDGTLLRTGSGQPLFHVEHSAGGTEQRPLNRWRIVHFTEAADDRLVAVFEQMAAGPWLPEHTEICLRGDLGIELARVSRPQPAATTASSAGNGAST